MRTYKFRGKAIFDGEWVYGLLRYREGLDHHIIEELSGLGHDVDSKTVGQFTGIFDKNGLQEVYEGDIIDEYGNIKGNTYEMDAGEADFIVQGFGDKNWGATYKEAVGRGCTDTQRYADKDEVRKLE